MGSKEDKQIHGLARFSVPRLLRIGGLERRSRRELRESGQDAKQRTSSTTLLEFNPPG